MSQYLGLLFVYREHAESQGPSRTIIINKMDLTVRDDLKTHLVWRAKYENAIVILYLRTDGTKTTAN